MINGTHILFYSGDPEADRSFFRDVLKFRAVDAGHGWLIFAVPPAEAALHPLDNEAGKAEGRTLGAEIYLMCDDLDAQIKELQAKGVACAEVEAAPWGKRTSIKLPSGGRLGLYQPRHATAIDLH